MFTYATVLLAISLASTLRVSASANINQRLGRNALRCATNTHFGRVDVQYYITCVYGFMQKNMNGIPTSKRDYKEVTRHVAVLHETVYTRTLRAEKRRTSLT